MNTFFKEIDTNIKNMEWPVIMPDEFHKLVNSDEKIAIIDIRMPEDANFEELLISNFETLNNNIDFFKIGFKKFVSKTETMDFSTYKYAIIICAGGPKSALLASVKLWEGKKNFHFLKGGVMEFKQTYSL